MTETDPWPPAGYENFSRRMYYDLDGNELTIEQYAALGDRPQHIGNTNTRKFHISTVWLGINHNWDREGPPLIFETMVFHCYQHTGRAKRLIRSEWRWSSKEEATIGHGLISESVKRYNRQFAQIERFRRYQRKRAGYPKKLPKTEADLFNFLKHYKEAERETDGCFYCGGQRRNRTSEPNNPMRKLLIASQRMSKALQRDRKRWEAGER